ncbi:lipopolysaccharide transport periplasmic protein LptA [Desulfurobacterium atlanticum]|uniref:Lipopolysaccharide export system protein LptA n=1 Tax=Desulfurobacterium atlanticum TaxID=240169 RepID=A0A238XRP8_9BACT|nr:lipopolysaccharide transport periplasmic protein LptA [Desulfurobacterium atlanticum]SNR61716.1 lipopolysaccharide export system protein LptA [Desulfurobacterium atlanticum]
MKKLIILFITAVSLTLNVYGKTAKNENFPLIVEARQLTYDKNKQIATYIGNVIVEKGDLTIKGDKLYLYFDKTGKVVEKAVMVGNVTFRWKQGSGKCDELEYFPGQEKVILKGNAQLKQGKNVIIGDRIVAFRNGNVTVEGIKQKVKTIIYPEETEK